ncbi:MAG: hypothetical protein ACTSWN_01045 [Promethearchaeota archaeon]
MTIHIYHDSPPHFSSITGETYNPPTKIHDRQFIFKYTNIIIVK